MKFFSALSEIFVDPNQDPPIRFTPKDKTEHYKKELKEVSLAAFYVATDYASIERKLLRYKYHSEREHVDIFVDLLSKCVEKYGIKKLEDALIVPVPMHWTRYFSRGFDHTAYMAKLLSKNTTIPYLHLLRAHWSRHQSKLSREKRLENKRNRFTMKSQLHIPKTVILIDDVVSSGATANECAKILKSKGVEQIIGVFLASNI